MLAPPGKYYVDPGSGRPAPRPGTGTERLVIWTFRLLSVPVFVIATLWLWGGKTDAWIGIAGAAIMLIQAEIRALHLRREHAAMDEALRAYEAGLAKALD
jgi:hypothetical protein